MQLIKNISNFTVYLLDGETVIFLQENDFTDPSFSKLNSDNIDNVFSILCDQFNLNEDGTEK